MEIKTKKTKTLKMRYPAPYTQSWASQEMPIQDHRATKKSSSMSRATRQMFPDPMMPQNIFRPTKKASSMSRANRQKLNNNQIAGWMQMAPQQRPDPFAPHLKYGVFPRRRSPRHRMQPRSTSTKAPIKTMNTEYSPMKNERKRPTKKGLESPMFVFRTIDRRFSRQLSQSEIMHVDIKPKYHSHSPRPAPKEVVSPQYSLSPLNRQNLRARAIKEMQSK